MPTTQKTKNDRDLCRVLTPEFRVSYPHVFKPSRMEGTTQGLKYSVGMLFPKTTDLSVIKEAMKQAKITKFGPKENWPKELASPVSDGDDEKNAEKQGYKGHWVMKASTGEEYKPGVVDENVEPILDQKNFYAGCYARAYILAYVWEFPKGSGKFGVGFILDHVQKMRDGKAFGGKKSAEAVFTPVNSGKSEDFSEDASDDFS